ncbi:tyrosine-type recombinase/integrase [Halorussus gelatinilyticus]|uniref:tyrosine-type recombinase/integrase n=1 Tax=Halorussus gelatinilyticus TaxID=2937524 RepID=UPI0034A0FDDC
MNRRMDALADIASMDREKLYPHCLRATAATFYAFRGLNVVPLQSLMGWADMATAQKYIRLSGGATAQALNAVHGD